MSMAVTRRRLTAQEYLSIEESAEHRSEFYRGEMYAMAGSSPAHSSINLNIGSELRARLRGSGCKPYEAGLHIHIPSTGLYTYPDASVVCGPLQFLDGSKTIVVNPSLIVEVLSPSTERYDRAEKFFHYQSIGSLRDYVLVSQQISRVEHFFRQGEAGPSRQWLYTSYQGLDAVLLLPSLRIQIPLKDIYEDVEFAAAATEEQEDFPHPDGPAV